jgi:hypothetical protein
MNLDSEKHQYNWKKLGLIFSPNGHSEWMHTHAQNPMPEFLGEHKLRIHFSCRDTQNRARGGYIVIDMRDPAKVLEISKSPTLELGSLGAFDDSGVMPSSFNEINGRRHLYYTGWSKAVTVPFSFHIGLAAESENENSFTPVSKAPVLGRNHFDPYITSAPFVLAENSGFRMWYISGTKWEPVEGDKPKHHYAIKHATSTDGFHWETNSKLCIDYEEDEYAFARPVVFRQDGQYELWFSYRGGTATYRLGRARSQDGITWEKDPHGIGLDVSPSGWDSEMVCYAHPFFYQGKMYVLYNGNGYGKSGVGLAVNQA